MADLTEVTSVMLNASGPLWLKIKSNKEYFQDICNAI